LHRNITFYSLKELNRCQIIKLFVRTFPPIPKLEENQSVGHQIPS